MITVKFGALFAGEGRRVVMTLALKDVSATLSEEYDAAIADVDLSFSAQGKPRDPQIPQEMQTIKPSRSQGRQRYVARGVVGKDGILWMRYSIRRKAAPAAAGGDDEDVKQETVANPLSNAVAKILNTST